MNVLKYFILLSCFLLLSSDFNESYPMPSDVNAQEDSYPSSYCIENVPYIDQSKLVSGCESVSATMLLNYWGYNISEEDFYDNMLVHKNWYYDSYGNMFAADPNSAYVGDARKKRGENCGFGCYLPALMNAINKVVDPNKHIVVNETGSNIDNLCDTYISRGFPVLTFATIGMVQPTPSQRWTISFVDGNSNMKIGDKFTWLAREHCILLIGYDEDSYIFNDPYQNQAHTYVPKNLFKRRFDEMGKQALSIIPILQ